MRSSVFRGLLLLSGVSAFVPPPTDVAVDCQNTKVIAKWNYSDEQQQTIFRVVPWFDGVASQDCKNTTTNAHQMDLSDCIWTSAEKYMTFIHVTVTAVLGGNQSTHEWSNTFSFNQMKTVDTKCTLDFPPVDVNEDDSKFTVLFQNPLVFYEKQFPVRKLDLKFTVVPVKNLSLQHKEDGMCTAKENICQHDLHLPKGVVTCFAIKGMLLEPRMGVQELILKETRACPSHSNVKEGWIYAVVLVSIITSIIIVAVFFVCKTGAWNMQSSDLPKSLQHVKKPCIMKYGTLPREDIDRAIVQRPHVKRLASSEGSNSSDEQNGSNCSLYTSGQALYEEKCFSESDQQELHCETNGDENSSNLSVKTECTSLESEEEKREFFSNYDAPHTLALAMGDGDHVTGDTEN